MRSALAGLEACTDQESGERRGPPQVPARGASPARLAGREMLLLVTGVGPVSAALELGCALGRWNIAGVVNIGLAGSFDAQRAPLGAAVIATAEAFPEYGVAHESEGAASCGLDFAFPQWEEGPVSVMQSLALDPDAASAAMGMALPRDAARGGALTVAGVTSGPKRAGLLAERFGALTESMEGFALALGCVSRGIPFLEIRTISNRVGDRGRGQWKLKQALAGLGKITAGLLAGRLPHNRVSPVKTKKC